MKPEEALTMEKLLNELQSVDMVKLVLTECGESIYGSREVYEAIRPFVEKQVPKKLRIEPIGNVCPECFYDTAFMSKGEEYCPNCGQKINWEETP